MLCAMLETAPVWVQLHMYGAATCLQIIGVASLVNDMVPILAEIQQDN